MRLQSFAAPEKWASCFCNFRRRRVKRKQLVQFYVERELIRRRSAPALHHSRLRRGIKCRVYLDHIEVPRIPRQPIVRWQFLRIPMFHKTRIRPTRRSDKNFPAHLFNEVATISERKRCVNTQGLERRNWLRGLDLNQRSGSCRIMSRPDANR